MSELKTTLKITEQNGKVVTAIDETVRVQFYHWDMGLFWKSYVQEISREEFEALQLADKGPMVIKVTADDWYGRKLPNTIRETYQRKGW